MQRQGGRDRGAEAAEAAEADADAVDANASALLGAALPARARCTCLWGSSSAKGNVREADGLHAWGISCKGCSREVCSPCLGAARAAAIMQQHA